MPTPLQFIEAEAMKLPPAERAELGARLIASTGAVGGLHPAWKAELTRRIAEMETGRTTPIPAEQMFAEVDALIETLEKR